MLSRVLRVLPAAFVGILLSLPLPASAHDRKSAGLLAGGLAVIGGGVWVLLSEPADIMETANHSGPVAYDDFRCVLDRGWFIRQGVSPAAISEAQPQSVKYDGYCQVRYRVQIEGDSRWHRGVSFPGEVDPVRADHPGTNRVVDPRIVDGTATFPVTTERERSNVDVLAGVGMIAAGTVMAVIGVLGDDAAPLKVSASRNHVRADYSFGF